jgi:hypothetical protein
MITFTTNNLHKDVPRVRDKFDRLLRIVGDFSIRVDSRILYVESEFPFVEFATQLTKWLAAGGQQDFSYDSVESDDPGLVWFRRSGEQWKVGSIHQTYEENGTFSFDEIRQAGQQFIDTLINRVSAELKINIEKDLREVRFKLGL